MEIKKDIVRGRDLRQIVRRLIDEVTKTPKEISEKETRQGGSTDLKLYILSRREPVLGNINELVERARLNDNVTKAGKVFLDSHTFEEEKLSEGINWLEITSTGYERTDEFILVRKPDYVWVLTTDSKKFIEETIERFIKYVPEVGRVYLPPEELEDVMENIKTSDVSGFTAKYFSAPRDRSATIRFHGAEPEDLEDAKRVFEARPTRIEFDQRNSPTAAIQGSGANDGLVKIESVRVDSEDKATDTVLETSEHFGEHDSGVFEVDTDSSIKFLESGFVVDEFTSIELFDPEDIEGDTLGEKLEEEVLSKDRYRFGRWNDNSFFVYDKNHEEVFELGIEGNEIVLHSRATTSELSLRGFCRVIFDEFNSTYSVRKKQTKGAV